MDVEYSSEPPVDAEKEANDLSKWICCFPRWNAFVAISPEAFTKFESNSRAKQITQPTWKIVSNNSKHSDISTTGSLPSIIRGAKSERILGAQGWLLIDLPRSTSLDRGSKKPYRPIRKNLRLPWSKFSTKNCVPFGRSRVPSQWRDSDATLDKRASIGRTSTAP